MRIDQTNHASSVDISIPYLVDSKKPLELGGSGLATFQFHSVEENESVSFKYSTWDVGYYLRMDYLKINTLNKQ